MTESLEIKSPQETTELKAGRSSGPSVGDLLSATRAQSGQDLQHIAKELRIRFVYLDALENSEHGKLPGQTYAIGFIRAYADYLGLDSEEVVRRFKSETTDISKPNELIFPIPVAESGIPGGAVVFIGLIIAVVSYGGWFFSTTEDGALRELISPVPERMAVVAGDKPSAAEIITAKEEEEVRSSPSSATAATPPVEQIIAPAAAATARNVVETAVADSVEPVEIQLPVDVEPEAVMASSQPPDTSPAETLASDVVEAAPVIPRTAEPMPVEPASVAGAMDTNVAPVSIPVSDEQDAQLAAIPSAPVISPQSVTGSGRVYGQENENSRIEVRATINSWIQVRDVSTNRLLLTRLLRAGDSYRVPDRPGLQLLTGNAGALEIRVDGNVAPAIGPLGAVRRNVSLDAVSLLKGNAANE